MGFLDNWRAKRKNKLQERLAKAQTMANDAKDIMKTIESPYVEAKKNLSEYETRLKFKPARAYKYASKGYTAAVFESESAKVYTESVELLESQKRLSDKRIRKLDSKYRNAISVGKSKRAKKFAYMLYAEASRNPDPSPLKISLDDTVVTEGQINIVVSNKEMKPIVINTITCRSGSMKLFEEQNMSEAVPAGSQTSRLVTFDPNNSMDIIVSIDYEMGFEHLKLKRTFSIRKKI